MSKSEVLKPSQPYQEQSLINRGGNGGKTKVDQTNPKADDASNDIQPIKNKKSTTIRCEMDTSQHISAIITCQDFGSVNEVLVHLIDLYEGNLTANERREIAQIKSFLARKNS